MATKRLLSDLNSFLVSEPILFQNGSTLELRRGTTPPSITNPFQKNGIRVSEIYLSDSDECLLSFSHIAEDRDFIITSVHHFLGDVFRLLSREAIENVVRKQRRNLNHNIQDMQKDTVSKLLELETKYGPNYSAIATLLHYNKVNSAASIRTVRNHCKFLETTIVDSEELAMKFMDVAFMKAGVNNFTFLQKFSNFISLDLSNKGSRDFLHSVYSAFINYENNGIDEPVTKDAPLIPVDDITVDHEVLRTITRLPIHSKMYRDFLLGLKLSDIQYLSGKLSVGTPGPAAVYVSERFLKNKMSYSERSAEGAKIAEQASSSFELKVSHKVHSYFPRKIIMARSNELETVRVVKEILEKTDKFFTTANASSKFVRLFLHSTDVQCWVEVSGDANTVIGMLHEKMPATKIQEVLEEVIEQRKPLSLTKWINYVENYDEYRDLPSSWWTVMV